MNKLRCCRQLATVPQALELLGEAGVALDLARPFQPRPGQAPTTTPLLAHVLSTAVKSLGLLGGVKLGLAHGTGRQVLPWGSWLVRGPRAPWHRAPRRISEDGLGHQHAAALADSGAREAVALAEALLTEHAEHTDPMAPSEARGRIHALGHCLTTNTARPSCVGALTVRGVGRQAGYPPIFYAVSLRELRLVRLLLAHRTPADVAAKGPGPYLPTPLHILLQLPDERVQLARVALRRRAAAELGSPPPEFAAAARWSNATAAALGGGGSGLTMSGLMAAVAVGESVIQC